MIGFIIVAVILAVVASFLVKFIDFAFNDGNLFDWYYKWLLNKVKPIYPKLAKPLGLCPICFGFWIGLIYYMFLAILLDIPFEFYWVFMPVNSFSTMKLFKEEEEEE
jgi:hypothetical protein